MNKETISDIQGISIIILFISGSTSIIVTGLDAKKDLWIAIVVAIIMVSPMLLIFARLHHIFPDKDLFDIVEICFGNFVGKILMIVFTWYTFYWTADVLNNYDQFIRFVSLFETPKIIPIILLLVLCTLCIKQGIEVLGRCAKTLVIIEIIGVFVIAALLLPEMDINNIRPVLQEGFKPIIKGANSVFTQPFVQAVAFTIAFSSFRTKKSSYRVYFMGLMLGALLILIISVTNILVIGINEASSVFYPSYVTVSRMDIGDVIQRLEVIIAIIFVLGGFIKVSILLLCTCKGVNKIFGFNDYRFIVWPITLCIISLAYFQYDNRMHYINFNFDIWPYYFFPFQIFLPIIIWIVAEWKKNQVRKIKL